MHNNQQSGVFLGKVSENSATFGGIKLNVNKTKTIIIIIIIIIYFIETRFQDTTDKNNKTQIAWLKGSLVVW